jgi:hypothetical protein
MLSVFRFVDRLWTEATTFFKCVGLEEVGTGLRGLSLGMEDLRNWVSKGCLQVDRLPSSLKLKVVSA